MKFQYTLFLCGLIFTGLGLAQNPGQLSQKAQPSICAGGEIPPTDYMVPLDDKKDANVAFEMKKIEVLLCGKDLQVIYELPLQLTGELNVVTLSGVVESGASKVEISGQNGNASCVQIKDGALRCDVNFVNLNLNPKKAISLLQKQKLSLKDFSKKAQAVSRFSGNPVGFFILPASQSKDGSKLNYFGRGK